MAELLESIVSRSHFSFVPEADSWQEAVRLSALPLVNTGCVSEDYYKQIVDCIEEFGPYVVFDHGVAMPHTTQNAQGVHSTAVSFMALKKPVSFGFDEDGNEKTAKLFFTLAAENADAHLRNIQNLIGIFMNEDLLDALAECSDGNDILAANAKYPCEAF